MLTFAYATSWFYLYVSFPDKPRPYKAPRSPPQHDQPSPTTNPSGEGDKSHRRSLRHPPIMASGSQAPTRTTQEDLLLTLDQTPMPKELLSATWCRYSSVLEAEKGREVREGRCSSWPSRGSAQSPRRSQCLPPPQSHLSNIPHSLPLLGPS